MFEYMTIECNRNVIRNINRYAEQGWRLHSWFQYDSSIYSYAILERERKEGAGSDV